MYRRLTHFLTVAGAPLGRRAVNDPLNSTTRSSSARFNSLSLAAPAVSTRRFLTFHRESAYNRFLQVLAFAGILAVLSFATAPQAQAQVQYISKLSNLCLSVNGQIGNSSTIVTGTCAANSPGQTFYFSNGFMRIGSPDSQYCVASFNGQNSMSQVGVWQCTNGPDGHAHPTQNFTLGMYSDLRNGSSNLCLNVQGGNTNAGTPIILYACSNGNAAGDMWTAQRPGATPAPAPAPTPAPPPPAPVTISSGPATEIISKLNNLCLSVNGGKIANGSTLITWSCVPNDPSQTFYFSGAFIRVGSPNSQYCLATFNGLTPGAQTGVWQCTTGPDGQAHPTQNFTIGMYNDVRGNSNLCLNVQGSNRNAGTPIILNTCSSGSSAGDMWTIQRPGPLPVQPPPPPLPAPAARPPASVTVSAFQLMSGLGSRCLAIQNGSTAAQARLVIWACNSSAPEQLFTFPADGTIRPFGDRYRNYCLDVQDSKGDSRTMVAGDHPQLYTCNGGLNQKFTFANGVIQTANGLVFDVWGGAAASWFSGAVQVQLWPPNGKPQQHFVASITVPAGTSYSSIAPDTQANIVPRGGLGGGIVSHNGSAVITVVGTGGGSLVSTNGGNVVAQGAGNLMSDASGHVVAQGAGNVVAQGAGNVTVPVANGVVAQGAGN